MLTKLLSDKTRILNLIDEIDNNSQAYDQATLLKWRPALDEILSKEYPSENDWYNAKEVVGVIISKIKKGK